MLEQQLNNGRTPVVKQGKRRQIAHARPKHRRLVLPGMALVEDGIALSVDSVRILTALIKQPQVQQAAKPCFPVGPRRAPLADHGPDVAGMTAPP